MEQGTGEWLMARVGKVTASRINDVLATVKTGESASRRNYRAELVVQRISGLPSPSYSNAAMQWGTDNEPLARLAYSLHTGLEVEEVGLIDHDTVLRSGASPDGLVGADGMVEIKCPNTATHIAWAIAGEVPAEHVNQMQWQMACTGRQWCDFVSFDPRMPEGQQLFIRCLQQDQALIDKIEAEVVKFDAEVEAEVLALTKVQWF
jgi:putative phage-type endonuclease